MIVNDVYIENFRAFHNVTVNLGQRLTVIAGRNGTQKTTLLGILSQPFSLSQGKLKGQKTIDGYDFKSQFKEKFKISLKDLEQEYRWRLNVNPNIYANRTYTIKSLKRKCRTKTTVRFWSDMPHIKGNGYLQVPVYYLSLKRVAPIGESSKIEDMALDLSDEEKKYCLENYRAILSIIAPPHSIENFSLKKDTSGLVYAGIDDEYHDVFTNSSGENNILKIIFAVLSFSRLKQKFQNEYNGGMLLIDEIESTLFETAQIELINFLNKESKRLNLQVIFTSHSQIVISRMYELLQSQSKKNKDLYSIVWLNPVFNKDVQAYNILAFNVLNNADYYRCLASVNLKLPFLQKRVKIYCENRLASVFVKFLFKDKIKFNYVPEIEFNEFNLGWKNYIQLVRKNVDEFIRNVILLDHDVIAKISEEDKSTINNYKNIIFSPITIERDLFLYLYDRNNFEKFFRLNIASDMYTYEMCFSGNLSKGPEFLKTDDYKDWYKKFSKMLGNDIEKIFELWCDDNVNEVEKFAKEFSNSYNKVISNSPLQELMISN